MIYDLSIFDAVEVMPVAETIHEDGTRTCEPIHHAAHHGDATFWSVYLHLREGGVTCIADCPTKADAYLVAQALEQAFPSLQFDGPPRWVEVQT